MRVDLSNVHEDTSDFEPNTYLTRKVRLTGIPPSVVLGSAHPGISRVFNLLIN